MNKKILIVIIVAIVIPLGVYTISPLFIESSVNEELPVSMQTVNDDQQQKKE